MMSSTPQTNPRRGWGAQWSLGWRAVCYLALDLALLPVTVTIWLLVVVGALCVPALGTGLVVLVPGLWLARLFAAVDRSRVESLLDVRLSPPRSQTSGWQRWLLDPVAWLAAAWTFLSSLWGIVAGALVVGGLALGAVLLLWPVYHLLGGSGDLRPLGVLLSGGDTVIAAAMGLCVLAAVPWVARGATLVQLALARWLIAAPAHEEIAELSARVQTLDQTRSGVVDSVEAERRRIERDLHDGPQQRLVALAMDLGMARDLLAVDPQSAQALVDSAHAASKEAITEMRQVARGIAPPILTDRGLDAALSALAARSPVPVDVELETWPRLDPTIEAIAYFCVSEALTNVAKHAGASQVQVRGIREPDGSTLSLMVTDDGHGGADPALGTGLTGLRQRAGSVDGQVEIDSPVGGPTSVRITLPWRERGSADE